MIEFFTVLMIDYEMAAYDAAPLASIVYASESHCQQVMDQGLADPTCVETDVVSSAIRPRARPES
jgi:hypothetical protein